MERKRDKEEGKVEIITGMFLLVILTVLMLVQVQVQRFLVISSEAEDALAASNLASAVIDVEEYGRTHTVWIYSADSAFGLFQEALKQNLDLDENREGRNRELVGGPVEIEEYTIYNVKDNNVTVISWGPEGEYSMLAEEGGLGRVRTPDGTLVETTSVYSRITFPVETAFGVTALVCKEKTVDIVGDGSIVMEDEH